MAKRAHVNAPATQPLRRKLGRVGPGTILAILGAAVLFISGKMSEPRARAGVSGRMVYEADANGKMQPVESPSAAAINIPPLWKPEPEWALQRGAELNLTAAQKDQIERLRAEWAAEKQTFSQAMNGSAAELERTVSPSAGHRGASMSFLKSGLADYSTLSRQYDARRTIFWQRTVDLLSKAQRERVETLSDRRAKQ